jgi:CubicO group peptidase (beta-lactamase class C family)
MNIPVKLIGTLALASLLFTCRQKSEKNRLSVSEKIDSVMQTAPDFSGVVLVADKGKPVYHKAFGYRNFETKEPNDTTTIFELASVSKQFTAAIIQMLHEEGALAYDDAMDNYLKGIPYPNITIRHLLTHTSGLPDYQAIMDEHWDKSKVANNNTIIEYLIKHHPPKSFEPGEKYEYSNTGYVLLASIAEMASGRDFIDLCREAIFKPLWMTSTNIRTLSEKAAIINFALGHIYVKEKQRYIRADSFPSSNYTIWLGNRKGPGRISSTTSDLLKWDQALYTEKIISDSSKQQAFSPMRLKNDSLSYYGFGWDLSTHPMVGKTVSHTGDNPGYKTVIVRFVEKNKTIIMLSNNAHKDFKTLTNALITLLNEYYSL